MARQMKSLTLAVLSSILVTVWSDELLRLILVSKQNYVYTEKTPENEDSMLSVWHALLIAHISFGHLL